MTQQVIAGGYPVTRMTTRRGAALNPVSDRIADRSALLLPALRQALQEDKARARWAGGRMGGERLDPHRLARLPVGDPRLFARRVKGRALTGHVAFALDESGSMSETDWCGAAHRYHPARWQLQVGAVALLCEALNRIGIKTAVFGFGSTGKLVPGRYGRQFEIGARVHKTFGDRWGRHLLTRAGADCGSTTGHAVQEATNALHEARSDLRVLVYVTDDDIKAAMPAGGWNAWLASQRRAGIVPALLQIGKRQPYLPAAAKADGWARLAAAAMGEGDMIGALVRLVRGPIAEAARGLR